MPTFRNNAPAANRRPESGEGSPLDQAWNRRSGGNRRRARGTFEGDVRELKSFTLESLLSETPPDIIKESAGHVVGKRSNAVFKDEDFDDDDDYQLDEHFETSHRRKLDEPVRIPISDTVPAAPGSKLSESGHFGPYGKKYVLPEDSKAPRKKGPDNLPPEWDRTSDVFYESELTCRPTGFTLQRVDQICLDDLGAAADKVRKM